MYFPDLSPYTYHRCDEDDPTTMVNVGWLDEEHDFPTGSVPEWVLDRIEWLCVHGTEHPMRGFHTSPFAPDAPTGPLVVATAHGEARLGFAEICLHGPDGRIYVAPSLLLHYIRDAGYRPPDEFLAAVEHDMGAKA